MSGPVVGVFDTETTGTDVESDRIVSAYFGLMNADGSIGHEGAWLIDPGIPIPEAATEIHGITTERAQAEGQAPFPAITEIYRTLRTTLERGLPVVIYNAPYDLTLLDREFRRHYGHGMLEDLDEAEGELVAANWARPILDPMVVDKTLDRFRKGRRTLEAVATHYAIPHPPGDFHGARFDAVLAGRLMLHLWGLGPLAGKTPETIHDRLIEHYRAQSESYMDYLESLGNDTSGVRTEWPIRPYLEEVGP